MKRDFTTRSSPKQDLCNFAADGVTFLRHPSILSLIRPRSCFSLLLPDPNFSYRFKFISISWRVFSHKKPRHIAAASILRAGAAARPYHYYMINIHASARGGSRASFPFISRAVFPRRFGSLDLKYPRRAFPFLSGAPFQPLDVFIGSALRMQFPEERPGLIGVIQL